MSTNSDTTANIAKHAYEASVKARALSRAGACNNLNGHILEIMASDKTNFNPVNWAKGIHETLSASPTEMVADSVITRNGAVLRTVQYKDCSHSIGDVVRRVKSGQYSDTTLRGTSETAKIFNAYAQKHGLATRMGDTGISQCTTKSLGRACGACRQIPLETAATWAARSGGIFGGAVSGGISAVSNIAAVCRGEKDGWEATGAIIKDTAGGALSGAGAAAAATMAGGTIASTAAGTALAGTVLGSACVVAAPVAVAIGVGYCISKLWNALWGD